MAKKKVKQYVLLEAVDIKPPYNLSSVEEVTGPFDSIQAAETFLRKDSERIYNESSEDLQEGDPEGWGSTALICEVVKTVKPIPQTKAATMRIRDEGQVELTSKQVDKIRQLTVRSEPRRERPSDDVCRPGRRLCTEPFSKRCRVNSVPGKVWYCTRIKGHKGKHVACVVGSTYMHNKGCWRNRKSNRGTKE